MRNSTVWGGLLGVEKSTVVDEVEFYDEAETRVCTGLGGLARPHTPALSETRDPRGVGFHVPRRATGYQGFP